MKISAFLAPFALGSFNLDDPKVDVATKWAEFKQQFGKEYPKAESEASAFAAFQSNEAIITSHNAKNLSYWLGHNGS